MDELDSYLNRHGIKINATDRRCAALHLHLTGSVVVDEQLKYNWQALRNAFLQRYNDMERTYSTDIEKFHSLTLKPVQRIDDFHSVVLNLRARLQLRDRDIIYRFIAGLPERLGFFVRVGRPVDHTQALESALSGAACGYRDFPSEPLPTPEVQMISGAYAPQLSVSLLMEKIDKLAVEVEHLILSKTL